MRIITSDGKRYVDIGNSDVWKSIYATVISSFGLRKNKVAKAIDFLANGVCKSEDGYETARQFNMIRDELSRITPEKAVYDLDKKKEKPSWLTELSPVITSCGNLYTTADGDDMIHEIVSIFSYAEIVGVDATVE